MNAHLQNYVEQNFRSKYDATTQASNWLSAELEELRIKVEKSEDARIAYERENQIWQIDEKQDITTQKLADLSKAVTDAQTDVAQKEALYRMAISGNVDALPAARTNDVISSLLRRKSELAQQYADAVDQYGPNFPKVLRIAAQQKELEENLASARKTMVESIEEEYETSQAATWICSRKRWTNRRRRPTSLPKSSSSTTFSSMTLNRINSSTTAYCKS